MDQVSVSFRLAEDDVAFLENSRLMERDRSYLIKKAVTEYIALHRWQIDEVEKALLEVETGDFASDEMLKATIAELRG